MRSKKFRADLKEASADILMRGLDNSDTHRLRLAEVDICTRSDVLKRIAINDAMKEKQVSKRYPAESTVSDIRGSIDVLIKTTRNIAAKVKSRKHSRTKGALQR